MRTKNTFIRLLLVGMLLQLITHLNAAFDPRPNVLIIITDDMGFSDPGCYGGEIETPNMDRLADEGIRFTQFYNSGRCWPTRSNIILGYYGCQTGSDPNRGHGNYVNWTKPLPQLMNEQGYRTYHSGKWHVQGTNCHSADAAGFDRAYDMAQGYLYFTPFYHALDGVMQRRPSLDDSYFMDIAIASHMIDFLDEHHTEHKEKPFVAYLSFAGPHYPLKAPAEYIEKYNGRYDQGWDRIRDQRYSKMQNLGFPDDWKLPAPEPHVISPHSPQDSTARAKQDTVLGFEDIYQYTPWDQLSEKQKREQADKMEIHAGMVDLIDEQIGRVLQTLESHNALDNTLVLFLSDNGADSTQLLPNVQMKKELLYTVDNSERWGSENTCLALGPAWAHASNTPFRRHKIWVHEGGVATPLIARWPKGITLENGSFTHTQGHVIDFVPTLLELAGCDLERATPQAPRFPGKSIVPILKHSAPERDFVFFKHAGNRGLIKGDWKAVSAKLDNNEWELYNLKNDRTEMTNLRYTFPQKMRELANEWTELNNEYSRLGGY